MERGVPKDCTKHRATLPKRLGDFLEGFFAVSIPLKIKWKLPAMNLSSDHLVKVGMAIALDPLSSP
jgi:hypothetical protein